MPERIVLWENDLPFPRASLCHLERTRRGVLELLGAAAVLIVMERRPSVILIREYDHQLTGSGCCGRLAGEFAVCQGEPVFAERRTIMERMGPVYRALKERFGEGVEIQVVDPRNYGLLFLLIRDIWAFRVGWRSALRTLTRVGTHAVVVNGRLADRTDHPDPLSIAAMVAGVPSSHPAARRSPSSLFR